jgi:hypothetical protein
MKRALARRPLLLAQVGLLSTLLVVGLWASPQSSFASRRASGIFVSPI